jgi:hypothetical protein
MLSDLQISQKTISFEKARSPDLLKISYPLLPSVSHKTESLT